MAGRPIGEVRDEIDAGNRVEIAAHLGRILRELHAASLDQVRALDTSQEEWLRFLHARRASIAGELGQESALPPGVIDECVVLLEARRSDMQGRLAPLNGDVTADHVSVERREGTWRISGLIDFADAVVAQVE